QDRTAHHLRIADPSRESRRQPYDFRAFVHLWLRGFDLFVVHQSDAFKMVVSRVVIKYFTTTVKVAVRFNQLINFYFLSPEITTCSILETSKQLGSRNTFRYIDKE